MYLPLSDCAGRQAISQRTEKSLCGILSCPNTYTRIYYIHDRRGEIWMGLRTLPLVSIV